MPLGAMRRGTVGLALLLLASCGSPSLTVTGEVYSVSSSCPRTLRFFDATHSQVGLATITPTEGPTYVFPGELVENLSGELVASEVTTCSQIGSFSVELPDADAYEVSLGAEYFITDPSVMSRTELEAAGGRWVIEAQA